MYVTENRHRLLLPHFVLFIFSSFPLNFCALLAHDVGHLWTQFTDEDTQTFLKGKDLSASGKVISQHWSECQVCLNNYVSIHQISHFIAYPSTHLKVVKWLLFRQTAQQIYIKRYIYIALCSLYILLYISVRIMVRVDFILYS